MAELAQAQSILKETLDKVATLEAQFDEANTKKVRRPAALGGRCLKGTAEGVRRCGGGAFVPVQIYMYLVIKL